MTTHPNRSPLHQFANHDFRNSTRAGFNVTVRADGTLRIERVNRWQGSTTGTVWIVKAPQAMMTAARGEDDDDEQPDVDTLIEDFLASDWQADAKRIRLGYTVR